MSLSDFLQLGLFINAFVLSRVFHKARQPQLHRSVFWLWFLGGVFTFLDIIVLASFFASTALAVTSMGLYATHQWRKKNER